MRHGTSIGGRGATGLMLGLLAGAGRTAPRRDVLTVAAFPAVDEVVAAVAPAWKRKHPDIDIKVVSRQFADHHTAMTTALATSFDLPDLMALEVGHGGRFAQGGGQDVLPAPAYRIERFVPCARRQATRRSGVVVAVPGRRRPLHDALLRPAEPRLLAAGRIVLLVAAPRRPAGGGLRRAAGLGGGPTGGVHPRLVQAVAQRRRRRVLPALHHVHGRDRDDHAGAVLLHVRFCGADVRRDHQPAAAAVVWHRPGRRGEATAARPRSPATDPRP